ncbi:Ubiquitin-Like Modifier-Activating Enzyme 1 [Manis pentadactyla]|nr:Ubiquitin-Like Modifier-Activating Enzyme 1 [Manis pentadactyla]
MEVSGRLEVAAAKGVSLALTFTSLTGFQNRCVVQSCTVSLLTPKCLPRDGLKVQVSRCPPTLGRHRMPLETRESGRHAHDGAESITCEYIHRMLMECLLDML